MKKGIIQLMTGVGLTTSMVMAQNREHYKPLAPEMNALVTPAALNPASIRGMDIPGEQLPAFLATTSKAIESSLKFMEEQACDDAVAVVETLDKAEHNPKTVLAVAFAKPMVQALPGISEVVRDTVSQEYNEADDALFAAYAAEVVEAVGAISSDTDPEAETAVRMAIAAAAFVNGATGGAGELAAALNALLPEDYQGPFENGETLVTLAALESAGAYDAMTRATGVDINIGILLPPPPAPVPFDTQVTRKETFLDNFPGRKQEPPLPPIPDPYQNQCGCAVFILP